MMTRRCALLLPLGVPLCGQSSVHEPAQSAVQWLPRPLFNGAPVLFRSKLYSGSAGWFGRKLEFRPDVDGFSALGGVDLTCTPGNYPLALGFETVEVPVVERSYPSSTITVPPRFVEPPSSVRARIARESAIKRRVFASSPPERRWRGAFAAPADTHYTSSFGVRRTYNGKTQSVHQGLDYSAALGTEIRAANSGRVAVAQNMYFEGGFVVIDHGESIFTLYMHLSEFLVRLGEAVETGEPIAKSGASGRVTGPHLHFAVRWQGLYLEPATLLTLWVA
jgi:murein DD-endopeptidase MepM/ murein hydrolase activator NlpD